MGFNSETGWAVGSALEGFSEAPDPSAPGQTVLSTIELVTSHEELMKNLSNQVVDDGEGYQRARVAFSILMSQYGDGAYLISKYVGGEHAYRESQDKDMAPVHDGGLLSDRRFRSTLSRSGFSQIVKDERGVCQVEFVSGSLARLSGIHRL